MFLKLISLGADMPLKACFFNYEINWKIPIENVMQCACYENYTLFTFQPTFNFCPGGKKNS